MEFCSLLVLKLSQSWYAIQTLISVETESNIWEQVFMRSHFLMLQEATSGCIVNLWSWIHCRCFDCLSSCVDSEPSAGSEDQGEQACGVDDWQQISYKPCHESSAAWNKQSHLHSFIFWEFKFRMGRLKLCTVTLRNSWQVF